MRAVEFALTRARCDVYVLRRQHASGVRRQLNALNFQQQLAATDVRRQIDDLRISKLSRQQRRQPVGYQLCLRGMTNIRFEECGPAAGVHGQRLQGAQVADRFTELRKHIVIVNRRVADDAGGA